MRYINDYKAVPGILAAPRRRRIAWPRLMAAVLLVCEARRVSPGGAAKMLGIQGGSMSRALQGKTGLTAVNTLILCEWAGIDPRTYLEAV